MSNRSNRMSMTFEGFNQLIKELEQLNADTKAITDKALEKTFDIVKEKAEKAAQKQNYPAEGKYSHGKTAKSLNTVCKIYWHGTEAEVETGYSISKGGLQSIFMIYGTPKHMKVQAMYDAFFSEKTLKEVRNAQREILTDAIRELIK